ncbi:hypothetical protein Amsp01_076770 [Amycolatopsis sp. NBRC 101858]|uniref:peptidase inhibitor family I36 protein n=1 Tax=Amycolatopsis sp. NBRC 101858 TaxID=3032200 RepID=UPI0024A27E7F|nr:peptidase inhibitor family I36 protein [Amycolatopsis sp. NBRC 101858]GLY41654.1 hypothetical protein Amsp01_076770 [Amycolatopsis sp. NBRC 101858]
MAESSNSVGRIGRRVLAALTVPVAALAVVAAPAAASEDAVTMGFATVSSWDACPEGRFCAWENADATGHWAYFKTEDEDLTKPINGYVFNDKFKYAYNRSGSLFGLYENIHYDDNGRHLLIASGWRGPLAPKYNFAGITSSLRWLVP